MRIRTIEDISNALSFNYPDQRTYTFLKEEDKWYIDLPDYLEQGGRKEDLKMVAGTDDLLTLIARGKKQVTVTMDTQPFEGADVLGLIELCDQPMGGGYYIMYKCRGREINKRMWLCDVTLFVFGDIPERIYIRKVLH
jgi:hypothetical protein